MYRSSRPSSTLLATALLFMTALFVACGDSPPPVAPETAADISFDAVAANAGPPGSDDWIVVFKPGVADPPGLARGLVKNAGGTLRFTYTEALQGFAARIPAQALDGIRHNPNIELVEQDLAISADVIQSNPPSWGLDRIDQRDLPLDDSYTYDFDGTGVTAYILDTGIRPTHNDFVGRASVGADFIGDGQNGIDCAGHGTHVAGTVGGSSYGVAKNVSLIAVRVLDCGGSGFVSGLIAGIDWITADHDPGELAVANVSIRAPISTSLDNAVANSVADGVTYAVSAGNANTNACNQSPAREPTALTVASTTSSDSRSGFSNYGTCVDLFAPGSSIISAWYTGDNAAASLSGTSMASPHVAGAAALYLDETNGATPAQVASAILGAATSGAVSDPGSGSPNLLLYSLFGGSPPPPPPPPPPAAATDVAVESVSDVQTSGKRHLNGSVTVAIGLGVDGSVGPASGISVTGNWYKNGDLGSAVKTTSGTTNSAGAVSMSSGAVKQASSLDFCVTSVSGDNVENHTGLPVCAPYSSGSPPPPPPPGQAAGEPELDAVGRCVGFRKPQWDAVHSTRQ
jgi:subtilisin family serine protease